MLCFSFSFFYSQHFIRFQNKWTINQNHWINKTIFTRLFFFFFLKFYYSILWFKIAFTVLTHLFIQNTVRLTGIEIKHMFDWFARNSNQDLLNCYASHSFLFSMLNLKWVKLLVRILKNKNDFFQKITEEVSKNHNKN